MFSNINTYIHFFLSPTIICQSRILEKICTANLYYPARKYEKCNITISSKLNSLSEHSPTFYYLLSKKPFEFR